MFVHIVSAVPAPAQGRSGGRLGHPVHLPDDLSTALATRGHTVSVHRLAGYRSPGRGDPLALDEAAAAGRWLAGRMDGGGDAVVHALDVVAWAAGLTARNLTGVPVVLRVAVDPASRSTGTSPASRTRRRVRQGCVRCADAVAATGEVDRRVALAAGAAAQRVLVAPDVHPAEPVEPAAGTPPERTVVSLSGVGPEGGAELLVEALRLVPGARLVIAGAGTGEQGERIRRLAHWHGLAERVEWRGWLDRRRVLALIDSAGAVACPSPVGGSAIALEAMWRARPVVAADIPALAEVVVDGCTGVLVRPGDPRRLGAALREVLNDPFRAAALGLAGLDRAAARYAPSVVVAATERAYRMAVGGAA
jgi:D-inositol-3-phosphate glycosyltransferase